MRHPMRAVSVPGGPRWPGAALSVDPGCTLDWSTSFPHARTAFQSDAAVTRVSSTPPATTFFSPCQPWYSHFSGKRWVVWVQPTGHSTCVIRVEYSSSFVNLTFYQSYGYPQFMTTLMCLLSLISWSIQHWLGLCLFLILATSLAVT